VLKVKNKNDVVYVIGKKVQYEVNIEFISINFYEEMSEKFVSEDEKIIKLFMA